MNQFPESIHQLHSLCIQNSRFHEQILQILENESDLSDKMSAEIQKIAQNDSAGTLRHCTAKQLFLYAIAMLRGIGTEENPERAFSLLTALIGNDAFVPSSILVNLKPYTGNLFRFCNELTDYIVTSAEKILASEDYRDIRKLIDYCELLCEISGRYLYHYNTDIALRMMKKILMQYFPDDTSMKSQHWLLNYYWMEADRNADNRYYDKMLNALFSAAVIASEAYALYEDSASILYIYKIIFVLRVYRGRKNSVYEEVKQNEFLDEVESDNTLKPPYKRQPRKTAGIRKIQEFEHVYLDSADSYEGAAYFIPVYKNLYS